MSFDLTGTTDTGFIGNTEKLMFTFQNGSGCLGSATLMENTDPFNIDPNSAGNNPGQHVAVMGLGNNADGNDWIRNYYSPVHDCLVDFGDAPDTYSSNGTGNYQTTLNRGGPSHVITPGLTIGSTVDSDLGDLESKDADKDDLTNQHDEDGVNRRDFPRLTTAVGQTYTVPVKITNNTGSDAYLVGYIDFNRDGDFLDAGEQSLPVTIVSVAPDAGGTPAMAASPPMSFSVSFTTPPGISSGGTFARFRLSSTLAEVQSPTGPATSGEVEDFPIPISGNDFGDAPDTGLGTGVGNYKTKAVDGGPNHLIVPGLSLGVNIDGDAGSNQNTDADADDIDQKPDDEDGVFSFPTLTATPGQTYTVSVDVVNATGSSAYLVGYIDFNRDGDFLDAGETSATVTANTTAAYPVTFATPVGMSAGITYARFRLSNTQAEVQSSFGDATSGEVEDYPVTITSANVDYGDAPDTGVGTGAGNYQTTATDGGASHGIVSGLQLGANPPDADSGSLQNIAATADDNDQTPDDEDSPASLPALTVSDTTYTATVTAMNTLGTGTNATLIGWVDFNQNGQFEASEAATATVPDGSSGTSFTLTWNGLGGLSAGTTYARFRLSTDPGLTAGAAQGALSNGEIEDFAVTIDAGPTDYGDAPDSGAASGPGNYQTRAVDGGPSHTIVTGLSLGAAVDADSGRLQNATAQADDADNLDDEDAVASFPTLTTSAAQTYTVPVDVSNTTGANAYLVGYIDFNKDGDFLDTGEQSAAVTVSADGTYNVSFTTPAGMTTGTSYARFRLSQTQDEATSPVGAATSGEVEDYQITFSPEGATGETEYRIAYNPATQNYEVYIRTNVTPTDSTVLTGAQVTIKVPHPAGTPAANLFAITGFANVTGTWNNSGSIVRVPTEDTNYDYISFDLAANTNFNFTGGVWVQAFTFKNAGSCLGPSMLMENTDPFNTASPNSASTDPQQNIAVVGLNNNGNGNDWVRNVGSADCSAAVIDYGDAPDSYGTTIASSGAAHTISAGLWLGSVAADSEANGQPNVTSSGDDNTDTDDEDSVAVPLPTLTTGTGSYSVSVNLVNITGGVAQLAGWIDFNGNGAFDSGERAQASIANGDTSVTLTWTGLSGIVAGQSYLRLRLANAAAEVANPTGNAASGEVEDFPVTITAALPTGYKSVQLTNDADNSGGPSAGDTLTWFIQYRNDGAPVTDFQIIDTLAAGVTLVPTAGHTVVTFNGPGTSAFRNPNYDGTMSGDNKLLDAGATLDTSGIITVRIPTKINQTAAGILTNQGQASWQGHANTSVDNTDNIDNTTPAASLPSAITVPVGSIAQPAGEGTVDRPPNTTKVTLGTARLVLAGKVFVDIGSSGSGANDGVNLPLEAGIANVPITLVDCTTSANGPVIDAMLTDGDGRYSFPIPTGLVSGTSKLCIVETNLTHPAYISTGASTGLTALTGVGATSYNRATDTIMLTYISGTNYANLNFGDVPQNLFLTDNVQSALPGTTIVHPHTFIAGSDGTVSFATTAVDTPTILGWDEVLFIDVNCDKKQDSGDTQITGAITVTAGQTLCLLMKEQVPAAAPNGAQVNVMVTANFSYSGANPSLTASYQHTDLTTVGQASNSALKLIKTVDKTTAKPGEVLTYTLTYSNNSKEPLNNIVVSDTTPAYTLFQNAACAGPLPDNVTVCNVTTQPAVNGTGAIKWTLTGSLIPTAEGRLTFTVLLQP